MDRRTFLAGTLAGLAAAACHSGPGSSTRRPPATGPGGRPGRLPPVPDGLAAERFALGVASGDPRPDSVILWTRVVADPMAADGGVGAAPVPVRWEVAADEGFDEVLRSGSTVADAARAHSVHVDARGLDPDRWYWYRFRVGDRTSPVGRTRTAPSPGARPERLRFGFASCQNRQAGHWTAHEHLAAEDLDLVVFLGDYIYDDAPNPSAVRPYRSADPTDLAGYRARWGEYKADPALQASHARFPWVCTWDDHEVSGNYAAEHPGEDYGDDTLRRAEFLARRAAAYQVYYENLPLRVEPPSGPDLRLHREVGWGRLARFFVLDTRQYRSDQAQGDPSLPAGAGPVTDEARDESRTMLGADQERWLGRSLDRTPATWNVLAQSVVMGRMPFVGSLFNLDQWDGYPAARRRLVRALRGVDNPVVISGDFHLGALGVITADPDDPSTPAVATEIVGTSISSEFPASFAGIAQTEIGKLPNIRYVNPHRRGYVRCEVTPDRLHIEHRTVDTTAAPTSPVRTDASFLVAAGDPEPRRAPASRA